MANKSEFIVNKKFLLVFVSLQLVITGLILYALLSPKSITVKVNRNESIQQTDTLQEVVVPVVNR